jgi:outer membrane protein OmpA-like peptidoglycan-associated protein
VQAAWLARVLRDAGGRVPGVATVEPLNVTLVLPAALDATMDTIAQERIFFAPGSSRLSASATESIQRMARLLDRLDSRLATVAARAALTILGRADDVGSDSLNTELSRKRAEMVMRSLQMAFAAARDADGTPRSPAVVTLAAKGIGTSDPISTTDSTARARINRSVSFGVRVSLDSAGGASPP